MPHENIKKIGLTDEQFTQTRKIASQQHAPSFQEERPAGDISGLSGFRLALKGALNEAAQARSAERFKQLSPVVGGVPGTMGDIARMIRGSIATPVEDVFTTILETRSEQQRQSMDLLETLARDGTLGEIPDSALAAIGRNAGLDPGVTAAWKSRIATAVAQDEETTRLEQADILSEINLRNAKADELRGIGVDDAPSPITLAYVDRVSNDVDFDLVNVPTNERNNVAKFIHNRDIKSEATSIGGIVNKLNALDSIQQTQSLTRSELTMWFINGREVLGFDYEDALEDVSNMPIRNKEQAKLIAGEIYGITLPQSFLSEGGEVGVFMPGRGETEERISLFQSSEDFVITPPDFSSFPSIFTF